MAIGKTIQELDPYGGLNLDKAKKDLIEISKNTGTYANPVYDDIESVFQTREEFLAASGIGKRLFESTTTVDIIFAGVTSDPYGFFAPYSITSADDGKRFVFNVSGISYVHYAANKAVLLNLPSGVRDGFCIGAHFNTLGGNRVSTLPNYLSSGTTHLITYRSLTDQWYVDEMLSIDSNQVTYLTNYSGSDGRTYLTSTNHEYVFDNTYTGNGIIGAVKQYALVDSDLCIGRFVDISLATDWSESYGVLKIYAEDAVGLVNEIVGHGATWNMPTQAKKGTHVRFKALKNNKWIIDKQNIII